MDRVTFNAAIASIRALLRFHLLPGTFIPSEIWYNASTTYGASYLCVKVSTDH